MHTHPAAPRLPPAPRAPAEVVLDAIEGAAEVRRRHHFFVWLQSSLAALLPHEAAVCAAYNRVSRRLHYEVFTSVVLPQPLLLQLADPGLPAWQTLTQRWVDQGCTAQALSVAVASSCADFEPLQASGLTQLLVHGVSRPWHPDRVESLFILMTARSACEPEAVRWMNLLTPHLHAAYLRALDGERARGAALAPPRSSRHDPQGRVRLTSRELQILGLIRTGLSNQAIADNLAISALTVKNHAQNIFRKLDVQNRTQAVACATSRRWLAAADVAPH
jgi:transcriptional regulator EpsA